MATIGVFYPKCMFSILLVHCLDRGHDNFISLLGNELFSCRGVSLHPSLHLLVFTHTLQHWTAYFLKGCGHVRYVRIFSRCHSHLEYLVSQKRHLNVVAVRSSSFFDGGWCKGWWWGYLNSLSCLCLAGVGVFYSFIFWVLTFVLSECSVYDR